MVSFPVSYFPLWTPTVSATAALVSPASLTVISNQSVEEKSVSLSSRSTPLRLPYSMALSSMFCLSEPECSLSEANVSPPATSQACCSVCKGQGCARASHTSVGSQPGVT